jgi:U6 snRNA-associated Sm-like protein LSm1
MSSNQRQQPHGGPAGAPPTAGPDFNAMLQRSLHEPGQQELGVEAPQRPSSSIGEVASTSSGALGHED